MVPVRKPQNLPKRHAQNARRSPRPAATICKAAAAILLLSTPLKASAQIPADPPSVAPPREVIAWIRGHAVEVDAARDAPDPQEARAIDQIIGDARVVGFGEVGHGHREPLDYRNRLVRYLVKHGGLTAVALESGLADTRRVGDYVMGGPGDLEDVVRSNLSWGFGDLKANIELAQWLRAYNAAHPKMPVRLYGIDASVKLDLKGTPELDANTILQDVSGFLARNLPQHSEAARAGLAPFLGRFTSAVVRKMDAVERGRLDAALGAADALFSSDQAPMVRSASRDDLAFVAREASDARRLPAVLADWTTATPPDMMKIMALIRDRDAIMADNVQWALHREGPRGRILVFAANGHVSGSAMVGSVMRAFQEQPQVMGAALRRRLGDDYRVIMSASALGKGAEDTGAGSIDRAFLSAGERRAILSLRPAPPATWWDDTQTFTEGDKRIDDAKPRSAGDGLVFFDQVTAAPAFARRN
jgi:erythromycin esterase